MPISITVNGEPRAVEPGTSVSALLFALAIKEARVAVEVNLDVIRREDREKRILVEGDAVEIVSFVGGGN
jgi:thiamine biosynthesis protein ThiS